VVYDAGGRVDYAYFPTNSIVSLLCITENGSSAEAGLVGNEGLVGVDLFLGDGRRPNCAVAPIGGGALRMNAKALKEEFARGGAFQHLLLRYTQVLITQISQTAVCNRLHPMTKRLCRLLLLSLDRAQSDHLPMTHQFISGLLGGRRESVTIAARGLQAAGLIKYVRGHIIILDPKGLEAAACECYRIIKEASTWLLGPGRIK
jgi:CRP-like cAMP-binding protein